jgi:hypothetical protein
MLTRTAITVYVARHIFVFILLLVPASHRCNADTKVSLYYIMDILDIKTNPRWARMVGYGPFSLGMIHPAETSKILLRTPTFK